MLKEWPYSKSVSSSPGNEREAPEAGEIFKQADLLQTLQKMVDAEQEALKKGKGRKESYLCLTTGFIKEILQRNLFAGARNRVD
jgi:gamma-glutamyltranspeptidase/glutathione hydrolase